MATAKKLSNASMQNVGRRLQQMSTNQKPFYFTVNRGIEGEEGHGRMLDSFQNDKFPLPGNVCPVPVKETKQSPSAFSRPVSLQALQSHDLMSEPLPFDKQKHALATFGKMSQNSEASIDSLSINWNDRVECKAIDAPRLIRKDFKDLFPARNLEKEGENFTMMTFVSKTDNDMASWTPQMESERDCLTAKFIETASQLCAELRKQGFWADFIDPSSGRPYLGPFTNSALFETDSRYRYSGVRVEDLGCCKVVMHERWGTHSFVASVFTNAPVKSAAVKNLLECLNMI